MLDGTTPKKKRKAQDVEQDEYDPRKREPQYAHADASPLWELVG